MPIYRVTNIYVALLLVIFLGCINFAQASDIPTGTIGVVTKNTFLLSNIPSVQREDRLVYGLVGYLPIGTRIYIEGEKKPVNNLSAGPEIYYPISSSIGIKGLIRKDLFKTVTKNPIGIVVSSTPLVIHNPSPKNKWKKLLEMGKYNGAYLEILGDSDNDFYKAILHRTIKNETLPESEPVRVWKELVNSGSIIIVNPTKPETKQSYISPIWSRDKIIESEMIDRLVNKIKENLGDNSDVFKQILSEADQIQCILSSDAKASLGFKLFGTGLSFNLNAAFKEQDHMYRFTQRELSTGNSRKTYTFLQNVRCEGSSPKRLQQLTVQEGIYNPGKRVRIELKDLESSNHTWKTTLAGKNKPFRMIQIRGESDYFKALKFLDKQVATHDSFISRDSAENKEILLNAILREISHFEHRAKILDQASSNTSNISLLQ